jgi:hypothetical protein
MKLNICLIFCLLINVSFGYFSERQSSMKAATMLLSPRFAESQNALSSANTALEKSGTKPYNFKVIINVIKETDTADDKPSDVDTMINFNKDTLDVLKNHKVTNSIHYTE